MLSIVRPATSDQAEQTTIMRSLAVPRAAEANTQTKAAILAKIVGQVMSVLELRRVQTRPTWQQRAVLYVRPASIAPRLPILQSRARLAPTMTLLEMVSQISVTHVPRVATETKLPRQVADNVSARRHQMWELPLVAVLA